MTHERDQRHKLSRGRVTDDARRRRPRPLHSGRLNEGRVLVRSSERWRPFSAPLCYLVSYTCRGQGGRKSIKGASLIHCSSCVQCVGGRYYVQLHIADSAANKYPTLRACIVQSWAKLPFPGLANFIPALVKHLACPFLQHSRNLGPTFYPSPSHNL